MAQAGLIYTCNGGDQNINICPVPKCGKNLSSFNISNSQKHISACQSKYNSKSQQQKKKAPNNLHKYFNKKQKLTIVTEIESKNLTDKTAITIGIGDDLSGVSANSEFIVPVPSFLSVSTLPPSSPDPVIPPAVSPIASIPPLHLSMMLRTHLLKLSINTEYVRDAQTHLY